MKRISCQRWKDMEHEVVKLLADKLARLQVAQVATLRSVIDTLLYYANDNPNPATRMKARHDLCVLSGYNPS